MINKIFKVTKINEDEIQEEKIQAFKTLSVVKEISDSMKTLGEKNTTISKRLMLLQRVRLQALSSCHASTEELMASLKRIVK
jgi:hypothetical protein